MKRISQEIFDKCNSLEDLVNVMNSTSDGRRINRVGTFEEFNKWFTLFTRHINELFPELTMEQILFLDEYYLKIRELYNWYNSEDLLAALEFELEKAKLKNG